MSKRSSSLGKFWQWCLAYQPLLWYLITFPLFMLLYLVPKARAILVNIETAYPVIGVFLTRFVALALVIIVLGTWGVILVRSIYAIPLIRDNMKKSQEG
ncbi:hypothetical protein [Entomospira culicis]|uniref:Uncharacterized protein n=1 Tax=Entomospira culicis TaxID=2719989 RepID=A0A968GG29_9SPIO|nr:hypothetical protein [Entomospira culicis]NIZ19438.1 hypothetical protein [Entomospira culicis]NIZ69657.1 hypothetical protein [Entomospira culicis]WDI36768.1 hypothetical protein PVA46_05440 [Entomospira culicis]WDI38397.1 hypothetical protein PVA47_05450 [Entomospira culicis]